MRRYIVCSLLVLAMLLGLTGCSSSQKQSDTIAVVATIFPQYDFARLIGGEYVDVTLLVSAGQEMHNYEPTALDTARIANCDLFLRIGGESEVWTETLLSAIDTSEIEIVTLMDYVCLLEEDDGEEDEDEEDNDYDEHIWTSPSNAMRMLEAVCSALCEVDPIHEKIYQERTEIYLAEWQSLDEDYQALATSCEGAMLVLADKFPFLYLTTAYGFSYCSAFSGCSTETEPTLHSLAKILEAVEEEQASTVFYLDFSSSKIADRIADITGANVVTLHPGHTVSSEELENGVSFYTLMRENYERLKEAFS